MLTYDMEHRGGLPLYEYLYRRLRQDILNGTLPTGERLPSKRMLAEQLGLSVITVENAYHQLEAEGYVHTKPRRGFFVSPVERVAASAPSAVPIPPEAPAPTWLLDLGRSQTNLSLFPVSIWAKLTRHVLSEGDFLAPTPHQGLWALRQAIAENLRDFKGMAVCPEQIVVGAGTEYLYLLLTQLLSGHFSGQKPVIAVEEPGYSKIRQVYDKCGTICRPVSLDAQGMNLDALAASGALAVHLSPNHHYPTGTVTSIGRRQALLRWAEETGGVIIEDDYNSEFRFTGRPLPSLQSLSPSRVIYLNTFSQTISPSMRVSFMVLPPSLLETYQRELGFYSCTVPVLDQHVLARFLADGHYSRHLSRIRKTYRLHRAAVLDAFRTSPFADRITISGQDAGLHFLLKLDTHQDDKALRQKAEGLGVRLAFLSDFAAIPHPNYVHTLVVNYAGLAPEGLEDAMRLLAAVFKE